MIKSLSIVKHCKAAYCVNTTLNCYAMITVYQLKHACLPPCANSGVDYDPSGHSICRRLWGAPSGYAGEQHRAACKGCTLTFRMLLTALILIIVLGFRPQGRLLSYFWVIFFSALVFYAYEMSWPGAIPSVERKSCRKGRHEEIYLTLCSG